MEIPVFTVDAFTNLPFKGNPAAVCLLDNELQDELYQNIAAEMNVSETAFLTKLKSTDTFSSGARFGLRWFTPINEIALCGHATLASAAVLFHRKENTNPVVVFETLSGELRVRQHGESLVMDFPLNKPEVQDRNKHKNLLKAVVGDLPVQDVYYCKTTKKLLVRLADTCDRSALTSLNPVAETLLKCEDSGKVKSVVVTIKGAPTSQPGYDFFSRNFAPWHGIPEDPVTGSAHTVLAAYWTGRLGKKKMLAYQCSRRGGELELELRDDGRVDIAGRAVVLLQGTLKL
ncbi:phenazine biosynthesis-like domain-containing protein 1 isoform X1 [Pygocentrus nattereri]|uniref:Phenazine biosynthesis like protein domain containing n=1 Tax=Pygocentrus nattereri TaxID=42514 RepID=A0AAR2IUN2_PYGNA|nr:phenazine biosynthesis-like domain-containing protein 1 isoform X1 [Pygocentrus nattereri]